MTAETLINMAIRGEEDGYDRKWFVNMTKDRRTIDAMEKAADHARAELKIHEAEWKPDWRFAR